MTKFSPVVGQGLSNSIEMHDRIVIVAMPQSKYGISPIKALNRKYVFQSQFKLPYLLEPFLGLRAASIRVFVLGVILRVDDLLTVLSNSGSSTNEK